MSEQYPISRFDYDVRDYIILFPLPHLVSAIATGHLQPPFSYNFSKTCANANNFLPISKKAVPFRNSWKKERKEIVRRKEEEEKLCYRDRSLICSWKQETIGNEDDVEVEETQSEGEKEREKEGRKKE